MLEKCKHMEESVLSTNNQEEMIQRFIECLQERSLDDYKHFMKLLYFTQQGPLATEVVASCKNNYSCLFAKRNYLLESLCASVCVFPCVFVFLHDNSKRTRSGNMKFKYIVLNENNSDKFDIEHCWTKVKVTARL